MEKFGNDLKVVERELRLVENAAMAKEANLTLAELVTKPESKGTLFVHVPAETSDEEEERRFMYVALTRAIDFLAITCSQQSKFIDEIRQAGAVLLRRG